MNITQNFLSLGKIARGLQGNPVFFDRTVDRIIIHWIGPYLQRISTVRDWWENGSDGRGVQASAHYVVKDDQVLQCLPLNEVGWHSGDARNRFSIGIEVCPMDLKGEFSQSTIDTLRDLILLIRQTHPNAQIIERHFDGTQKKDCPRYYTPIVAMLGEGRVSNPAGGDARWEELRHYIHGA